MTKDIQFQKGIIPTVLSYDLEKRDFIIGEEAKVGGIKGVTNAYNFKELIGKPDTIYKSEKKWINPGGSEKAEKAILLSIEEVTKEYLRKLLEKREIAEQIYIGIPAVEEGSWINNYKQHIKETLIYSPAASPPVK